MARPCRRGWSLPVGQGWRLLIPSFGRFHPLSQEDLTEATIWSCRTRKSKRVGTEAMSEAAMMRLQSPPYWFWNWDMPTCTTHKSESLATVSGHRKLFHVERKVVTPNAASIDRLSGSTITKNRRT